MTARTGFADLPLHGGDAPPWLFKRMVGLSEGIVEVLVDELGRDVFLERVSDPFWFQALACTLGFDWHSSGTTTVTCGALKEALSRLRVGVRAAGGKGGASRKTPDEIMTAADDLGLSSGAAESLVHASRLSAKVDSAAVQDGHQLYHHVMIFTEDGSWAVVQQGLDAEKRYARRYHWHHRRVADFMVEPHSAILGSRTDSVLDMTSRDSAGCRRASVDLVRDEPGRLKNVLDRQRAPNQSSLDHYLGNAGTGELPRMLSMPRSIDWELMRRLYDFQPSNYEELLAFRGVGPATVRALALVSDLIYGDGPSWRDPVKYSFTVGGKDGVPYPVDRRSMDECIEILKSGIAASKAGDREKTAAVRRLRAIVPDAGRVTNRNPTSSSVRP